MDDSLSRCVELLTVPQGVSDKREWTPSIQVEHKEYLAFARLGGHGYTSDGMFHFFGPDGPVQHNLVLWNEPGLWRSGFGLDPKWCAVAEDAFGGQFCIRTDASRPVVKYLSLLDGAFGLVANTFERFIANIVTDPNGWKELKSLHAKIRTVSGNEFRPFTHVSPLIPPLLGGSADKGQDFEVVDAAVNASILAQVYAQR